ncbi:MAG: hypothetical protein ACRDQA_06920 [Nocardioidaceae bacterium]
METGTRAVEHPTRTDLEDAWRVVREHLAPTPLDEVSLPGSVPVALKLESLQPTGAFKVRPGWIAGRVGTTRHRLEAVALVSNLCGRRW